MVSQAPLSIGLISQTRILSRLPFHSPWALLDPGIKPTSPALAGWFLTTVPPVKPKMNGEGRKKKKKDQP